MLGCIPKSPSLTAELQGNPIRSLSVAPPSVISEAKKELVKLLQVYKKAIGSLEQFID